MNLTNLFNRRFALEQEFAAHQIKAESEGKRIAAALADCNREINNHAVGLDQATIDLAETVISVSDCRRGGSDWRSCIADAIKQLATGVPVGNYTNLWNEYFGTKNYDRWTGQRSDHSYGYGPKHGSICFSVELCPGVRTRAEKILSVSEQEAAIYYLVNLEAIQKARREALETAGVAR